MRAGMLFIGFTGEPNWLKYWIPFFELKNMLNCEKFVNHFNAYIGHSVDSSRDVLKNVW